MAISLEELALGALEGSAGPWTLAVGAGALAVALAAGSARPVRRMASTGVFVSQRRGQVNLAAWLGSARQRWLDLVAEARAEYEAGRRPAAGAAPLTLPAEAPVQPVAVQPVVSPAVVSASPAVEPVSAAPAADHEAAPPASKRDQRGRFVRRPANSNGTRSE